MFIIIILICVLDIKVFTHVLDNYELIQVTICTLELQTIS